MDAHRFDRLTRHLSSRRTFGGVLLGACTGLLGREAAEAAPCRKGQKRCGRRCIPRRACCRQRCPGRGQPNTSVACAGRRCRLTRHFRAPGSYRFVAPRAGTLRIDAQGGAGGKGGDGGTAVDGIGGAGRQGAGGTRVVTSFRVAANQAFTVIVGGAGGDGAVGTGLSVNPTGGAGGAGGGNGATAGTNGGDGNVGAAGGGGGGGGGGTSEIRTAAGIRLVAASGGGGGGGGGGGVFQMGATAGDGGDGGNGNRGDLSSGTGGTGGPGGIPAGGAEGTPGEAGQPGGGFPAGAQIIENANPGPGRITLIYTEA